MAMTSVANPPCSTSTPSAFTPFYFFFLRTCSFPSPPPRVAIHHSTAIGISASLATFWEAKAAIRQRIQNVAATHVGHSSTKRDLGLEDADGKKQVLGRPPIP
ncbi:hypothetical protein H0G86_009892 [Trichoderma simmonsii]|uniref:Uncharacterized protein n=1 Tax=Trichoderma simmonsii TaxID=1491479 RepID=A0A8G0LIF5_9HYPO|nr:hypothetical protein H0G86_009892 [Trichoderma simmonsii]